MINWTGCYDDGWQDLITPESFTHPAKMARGLVARIFDELFARGDLQRGDLICDPFGGIGTTGLEAAGRGCQFIGCEVEPRFVRLARENFALHAAMWAAAGYPQPVMVEGDSRRLREHIGPALAECVVSSPPFETCDQGHKHPSGYFDRPGRSMCGYPETQGQLGQKRGETFWSAAAEIVRESHAILKPGGVAVWVVKSFVRRKQIVDFPGDWRRLCEAVGFELIEEVHAMLVTEDRVPHLWDGEKVTRRKRASFFRRLAESKGAPSIDWETVWFLRKPSGVSAVANA